MFARLYLSLLAVWTPFQAWSMLSEEEISKKIYAHLLIRDPISAVAEAKQGLALFPQSTVLQKALIRSLCESGSEIEAFEEWQKIPATLKEGKDRFMIETLAWGVLNKAEISPQLPIIATSLLGATYTNDVRALPILLSHLRSSNALLRSLAVRQAAAFGDAPLQQEIIRLLREEKAWHVRQEVIRAVGQMRLKALSKDLKEIIANPKTLSEEKVAAIISLVSMYDTVEKDELKSLLYSNRSGLRHLACELITHFNLHQYLDEVIPLLRDPSSDVRISALTSLGLLNVQKWRDQPLLETIQFLFEDTSPEVSITAGWLAILLDEPKGIDVFEKWLQHSMADWRHLAAGALVKTGRKGVSLSYKFLKYSHDPYVRLNVALGLLAQRQHVEFACEVIYKIFHEEREELWMWDQQTHPLFDFLSSSKIRHHEQIPHFPKVVDQHVRLNILSALSIVRFSKAKQSLREFLKTQIGQMPNFAAAILLEEGDEEEIALVKDLLNDQDEKIRLQAAFILAFRGKDTDALVVLKEAYPRADREMKIHILEAVAQVGGQESIPFLLEILKEPFQIMRIVAASALIQCLYH